MQATISFISPARSRRPGAVAGIAVSLLLHAALLFGYRVANPPAPQELPARTMTVWLQPVRPPVAVAQAPRPPEPERAQPLRPAPHHGHAPAPVAPAQAPLAQQPPAVVPAQAQAVTVAPAADPLYPDQQPRQFDMEEARKTARALAKEKAKPGTLAAQLEAHPLYPEDHQTQLQKGVASAKKSDCLQSASGAGLLAPLFWALDKHCKF
jgi:hypothetical protein